MPTCWFSFKYVSVKQRIVHKVLVYKTCMLCDLALLFQKHQTAEQINNFLSRFHTHVYTVYLDTLLFNILLLISMKEWL